MNQSNGLMPHVSNNPPVSSMSAKTKSIFFIYLVTTGCKNITIQTCSL
uniref:Uncharacterized protein n=1 Tax=Arundo donax TaxID=35708 RepID=A0A0A9GR53_ARUDO